MYMFQGVYILILYKLDKIQQNSNVCTQVLFLKKLKLYAVQSFQSTKSAVQINKFMSMMNVHKHLSKIVFYLCVPVMHSLHRQAR